METATPEGLEGIVEGLNGEFKTVSVTFDTGYVVTPSGRVGKKEQATSIFSQIFLNVSTLSRDPSKPIRCFLSARVPRLGIDLPLPQNVVLVKHGKYTHVHMYLTPEKVNKEYLISKIEGKFTKIVRAVFAFKEEQEGGD